MTRAIGAGLVTLGLAMAKHLDWHAARSAVHHLSLGWRWHWLLAVPSFGLTAWYVLRVWPERVGTASVAVVGVASLLAGVVEPAWAYWANGASFEGTFGPARLSAFAAFLATGTLSYVALVGLACRRAT